MLSFFLAALLVGGFPVLPDHQITPGAVRTTNVKSICSTRTRTIRDVTASEKSLVLNQYEHKYGVRYPKPYGKTIEFDHLLSLEDSGSNSPLNLWPQLQHVNLHGRDAGAKTKDKLENRIHHLICAGTITPAQARQYLTGDWIAAYRAIIGQLPAYNP
jgi:hypothetical protein